MHETIAAIATGLGESGIGVVRASGPKALAIADKIFLAKDGAKPSKFKAYTLHYGWVMEDHPLKTKDGRREAGDGRREIVDEVLLSVMRAPRSYTREDVVEFSCHGGIVALRRVLDLALENGARLAQPGEFTKRAFLNGRIDLAQAEAVLDIIRAKTDLSLKLGEGQLKGEFSRQVHRIRKALLDILAVFEAGIDFPEEEEAQGQATEGLGAGLKRINQELKEMLATWQRGRIFREGVNLVICGRPNAGKSSLLNALLKRERSIVTPIAGTTRDAIEEVMDIRGVPVRIADTAGIIQPRDLIEKKAVNRSREYIAAADLVLLVFDAARPFSADDRALVRRLRGKKVIAVLNKIDLRRRLKPEALSGNFSAAVEVSAKKSQNIGLLEEAIAGTVFAGKVALGEPVLISNTRHREAVFQAQKLVARGLDSLHNKMPSEFVAQSIKEALARLDELLGRRFSEDLLDKIFSEFCIGK